MYGIASANIIYDAFQETKLFSVQNHEHLKN